MNFYKLQRISSIIPRLSTCFILIVTMIQLKRQHAGFVAQLKFFLIGAASVIVPYVLTNSLLVNSGPMLNFVIEFLILTGANMLLVDLQEKVAKARS